MCVNTDIYVKSLKMYGNQVILKIKNKSAFSIKIITKVRCIVYVLVLDAILVSPGNPGILLSLTAIKSRYSNGDLDTEIVVDPEAVDKAPVVIFDDGGGGGGSGRKKAVASDYTIPLIIVGISVIAAVGVIIFIMKKRSS